MDTPNALGFIALGMIMGGMSFVPTITGVREMWLLLMGGVLMTAGTVVLAQTAWLQIAPRLLVASQASQARRQNARVEAQSNPAGRIAI